MLPAGVTGICSIFQQATGRLMRTIWDARRIGADDVTARLMPAIEAIWTIWDLGSLPAVVKALLAEMGTDAGDPRPPLLPLTDEARRRLGELVCETGLADLVRSLD